MTKRFIRLKELAPHTDVEHTPSEKYLRYTDGTLGAGPFRCRTDMDGFIITGNPSLEGQALVFLGDSFVESMYEVETQRFVARAERTLNSVGTPRRCLNAGYSGSTSLQLLNVLVNKIYPCIGRAGDIVFFVPQNDAEVLYLEGTYWVNTPRHAPIVPPSSASPLHIDFAQHDLMSVLEVLVSICRTLGLRLILATSPFRDTPYEADVRVWRKFGSPEWHSRVQSFRRGVVATVRDVAEKTQVPLLDIADALAGDPRYFYDDLHLNSLGQEYVGSLVTDGLRELLADRATDVA